MRDWEGARSRCHVVLLLLKRSDKESTRSLEEAEGAVAVRLH
jgi:hypothetical protein